MTVLLDMGTQWKRTSDAADSFEGCCRMKGDVRWTDSRVDLVFGSNSEFRALAEVYACDDAKDKFVRDFVAAWDKVMSLNASIAADHRFAERCANGRRAARPLPPRRVRPRKILCARPRLKIRARPASLRINEHHETEGRLSWRQRKKLCRSALSFPP